MTLVKNKARSREGLLDGSATNEITRAALSRICQRVEKEKEIDGPPRSLFEVGGCRASWLLDASETRAE